MSEAAEWQELMRGLSVAVEKVEEAADGMDEAIVSCDRFIERANSGLVEDSVRQGLRVGLAFCTGADWARSAVERVAELRERLAETDEQVAEGELPATAHSWRHQLGERLETLDRRTERLKQQFAERWKKLEALSGGG